MSKLQKSAWINLGLVTALTLINMLMFVFMAKNNAKGVDFIIVGFVPACIATPIIYIVLKKKSIERKFDEREKMISKRSFTIAALVMIVFLYIICTIPFFIIGGGNTVDVIYLPLIFFSTLLTVQFAYSMAVIVQCAMEEEDG